MPKQQSKQAMVRSFKPWRKGKSKNAAGKKGSLKHQMRGLQRLLAKQGTDPARKQELEAQIETLRKETKERSEASHQRDNARKSHGRRFMERQKLVRMEKATCKLLQRKLNPSERERCQMELYRIALDQVYVAHFPHDKKYMPLFRSNARVVDGARFLNKRAQIRAQILGTLDKTRKDTRWISQKHYSLVPSSWTFDQEKEAFGVLGKKPKRTKEASSDSRFSISADQERLMQVVNGLEAELDKQEEESRIRMADKRTAVSSEASDEVVAPKKPNYQMADSDDLSDSSSSSDIEDELSDGESNDGDNGNAKAPKAARELGDAKNESSDEDDFLLAATQAGDAFVSAKEDLTIDLMKGDKSQGWKTQRQRPGEFRRKRQRRN